MLKIYNDKTELILLFEEKEEVGVCDSASCDIEVMSLLGFDENYAVDYETVIVSDGSQRVLNAVRQARDFEVEINVCNCPCFYEKLNLLYAECCNVNYLTLEYTNDCGKSYRFRVLMGKFDVAGSDDIDCKTYTLKYTEIIDKNISKSEFESTWMPSLIKPLRKYTSDCACFKCYEVTQYTKTGTICGVNRDQTVTFIPDESLNEIYYVVNGFRQQLNVNLVKNDVLEIRDSRVYVNGIFIYTIDLTYSNNDNCISIETPNKTGQFAVISWENIASCEVPIYG